MCIIISKPEKTTISKDIYKKCFEEHPHGAGFAYVEDNKLVIDKGYWKASEIIAALKHHEEKELLIHFRTANRGTIDFANCHPFHVPCDGSHSHIEFAIVHNGTLDYPSTKNESDTNCFIQDILGHQLKRDPWFLDHPCGKLLLEKFMGYNNKIAVMRHDSIKKETKTYIFNEIAGNVAKGIWFSNYTWKTYVVQAGFHSGLTPYALKLIDGQKDKSQTGNGTKAPDAITKETSKFGDVCPTEEEIQAFMKYETEREMADAMKFAGHVEVPRDAGVLAEEPTVGYEHLTKKQRKELFHFCARVIAGMMVNADGFSGHDRVNWVRTEMRQLFPDATHIKTEDLDIMMATNHWTLLDVVEANKKYLETMGV